MTSGLHHVTAEELEAGLPHIGASPADEGVVELIVRRPRADEREVIDTGELHVDEGLVGDRWPGRGSPRSRIESARYTQVTLMNARVAALVAGGKDHWPLAGDQLYVDFDLSGDNLPEGTRLGIGTAVVEVTGEPHTGCGKFAARFGHAALRFVNSPLGKRLNLRGINTRVVEPGIVRPGDVVKKVARPQPSPESPD